MCRTKPIPMELERGKQAHCSHTCYSQDELDLGGSRDTLRMEHTEANWLLNVFSQYQVQVQQNSHPRRQQDDWRLNRTTLCWTIIQRNKGALCRTVLTCSGYKTFQKGRDLDKYYMCGHFAPQKNPVSRTRAILGLVMHQGLLIVCGNLPSPVLHY